MSSTSVLSNWRLFCSDDGVLWDTAHIAADQKNWSSGTPKHYDLSGVSHFPVSTLMRGRVALFGLFYSTLDLTGLFKVLVKTIGYGRFENLLVTGSFIAQVPTDIEATFHRYLLTLTPSFHGVAGIGGRLSGSLTKYTIESSDDYCFSGRVTLYGVWRGAVSHLQTAISAVIRIPISVWLNLTFADSVWRSTGGISNSGKLFSQFTMVTGSFQGSALRLKMDLVLLSIITAIKLRSPIGGSVEIVVPLEVTTQIFGVVPLPIYITGLMHLGNAISFMKILISIAGKLELVTDWPKSARTFAVTYVGIMPFSTKGLESTIYIKAGPPVIFSVAWQTVWPTGSIFGIGHVRARIVTSTLPLTSTIAVIIPSKIYGQFVSEVGLGDSNIRIKNWRWFKADEVRWQTHAVTCMAGGLILIGGHWRSVGSNMYSTEVFSYIYAVIPIPIQCILHPTMAPVYSPGTIIARSLIYGRLSLTLGNVVVKKFIGNINVGRLFFVLEKFTVLIRLRTIIHAIGTLSSSSCILTTFTGNVVLYGRIANRGRVQIKITNTLTGLIRLHVPVIPAPIYGSFVVTLATFISGITAQERLKYGRINRTLSDVSFPIRAFYICRAVLASELISITWNIWFKVDHFAGHLATTTEIPTGNLYLHSRVLARLMLTLNKFTINFDIQKLNAFRGHLLGVIDAYQGSPWKEHNGGVFSDIAMIFKRLVYGKFEGTTAPRSIWYTDFTGIVPRAILGLFIAQLGTDYDRFDGRVANRGYMDAFMGLEAIKRTTIFGSHVVGTIEGNVGLDPVKNEFTGIAAHAIEAVINLYILNERINTPHGYVYPLSVNIRGRAKIYGAFRAPTASFDRVYFRSASGSTGYILGGDTMPVTNCPQPGINAPCQPELEARIGRHIDPYDKLYWTLRWLTSKIDMIHRFPIIGRLYSPNMETVGGHWNYYIALRGNIKINVAVFGTMDVFISSYSQYGAGLIIYAKFTGFTVSGPMQFTMRDLRSTIEINVRGAKIGRLAADLKTVNGQCGGYHVLKGFVDVHLAIVSPSIGGRVPIRYQITFTPVLGSVTTIMELNTPIRIFGVFLNYYLNELTTFANFKGWMTAVGSGAFATAQDTSITSEFLAKITNVLGTFIPTARLDRVLVRIVAQTVEPGGNPGFINAWFLASIPSSLTGNIRCRVNIYQNLDLNLSNNTSIIYLRTPIRIWTYWHNSLQSLSRSISGIAWPTAHPNLKMADATTNLTFQYYSPRFITFDLVTANCSSVMIGRVPCYGSLITATVTFTLSFGLYHCTYGYLASAMGLTGLITGTSFSPGLYLPREPIYTVAGTVDNVLNKTRTYFITLYDRSTCELVAALPGNQSVPFDYTFGEVSGGQYFVLCKPAQVSVGTRVKTVLVDLEEISRFS